MLPPIPSPQALEKQLPRTHRPPVGRQLQPRDVTPSHLIDFVCLVPPEPQVFLAPSETERSLRTRAWGLLASGLPSEPSLGLRARSNLRPGTDRAWPLLKVFGEHPPDPWSPAPTGESSGYTGKRPSFCPRRHSARAVGPSARPFALLRSICAFSNCAQSRPGGPGIFLSGGERPRA